MAGRCCTARRSHRRPAPLAWTGGLHPYWATPDVLATTLLGGEGLPLEDRYDAANTTWHGAAMPFTAEGCERLVRGAPALELVTPAGSAALKDLPAGDWRRFVCVEPVVVTNPVTLEPGQGFTGRLRAGG